MALDTNHTDLQKSPSKQRGFISRFIQNLKDYFSDFSSNEKVLLGLTASIFLGVTAEIIALILLPFYIFRTNQQFIFLRRKKDLRFLSIFWVLSILVTAFHGGELRDFLVGIFMVFAFAAMIFIAYTMTQRTFRIIISFCCFMSVPCLIVALVQDAMGLTWSYGARYPSVFYNPNYYAFFISLVILFCLFNISKSEKLSTKFLYGVLIPINLFALYLTECRTTFVVVAITCPIMLAFFKKKRWLFIYLGVFAALLLGGFFLGDTLTWIPRMDSIVHDLGRRLSIWGSALDGIKDAPIFGYGYNAYSRIFNHDSNHAHNLVLEILLDFGVAGFLLLFAYFFINVDKIIHLHRQNKVHMRYALTLAVIVSVILHGFLDITMLWPQTGLLVMYVVGFSTEYDKKHIFSPDRSHNILFHQHAEEPELASAERGISDR